MRVISKIKLLSKSYPTIILDLLYCTLDCYAATKQAFVIGELTIRTAVRMAAEVEPR